jgi:hypothetical protein
MIVRAVLLIQIREAVCCPRPSHEFKALSEHALIFIDELTCETAPAAACADKFERVAAERLCNRRIRNQKRQSFRERFGIIRRDENSRAAIDDCFSAAGDVRGNGRPGARTRFVKDEAEAL